MAVDAEKKGSPLHLRQALLQMRENDSTQSGVEYYADGRWQKLSFREYFYRIQRLALQWIQLGISPGDRIAIFANTRLEWALADLATQAVQAIAVPIYPTASTEEIEFILNDSEAKILIVENRSLLRSFRSVEERCIYLRQLILIDEGPDRDHGAHSWADLTSESSSLAPLEAELTQRLNQQSLSEVATIVYTSGTTGRPKGVSLTHQQIHSEVSEAFPLLQVTSADRSLTFLPLAHILGRIEIWGHVYHRFTLCFGRGIDHLKQDLVQVRPTLLVAVPRVFEKIYSSLQTSFQSTTLASWLADWALGVGRVNANRKQARLTLSVREWMEAEAAEKLFFARVRKAFGGRLRYAVCGGAPLAPDVGEFFAACGLPLLEGYGLTETTGAICVNRPFDFRFGSVGKPVGDVELRIAEDGEVLVRSHKVMNGYWNNPEATTEVLDPQGWLHTGDIGEILPSGDLRITDRKKDLIKTSGGKYVAPQKVEGLLRLDPLISHALIHGDHRKFIVALLTLNKELVLKWAKESGTSYSDYAQLTQHPSLLKRVRLAVAEANQHLASHESIKRFSILPHDFSIDAGELTPSLKVKRKVCDQRYRQQIEALYQNQNLKLAAT